MNDLPIESRVKRKITITIIGLTMNPSSFDPNEDSPDLDNALMLLSPSKDYIYFVNIKNENKRP